MSGCGFMPPIIIPMMEIPTAMIALGMLGFELVQGLSQISNAARTTCDVDHVLINKSGLKIGLRKDRKGKLELLIDEDELRQKEGIELKEFRNQFQKRYAYAKLVERLKAEGYTLVEEKEETNETIRLVVRRWR
jgi:hypothetical protein